MNSQELYIFKNWSLVDYYDIMEKHAIVLIFETFFWLLDGAKDCKILTPTFYDLS